MASVYRAVYTADEALSSTSAARLEALALDELGFKFIFITLGRQHAMGNGFSELLSAMAERQEQGYIELQRREWEEGKDFPTRSHHEFSGVPYHHLMGEEYSSARLGREFVEELPEEKVV